MKTFLLTLSLALAGSEIFAQTAPPARPAAAVPRPPAQATPNHNAPTLPSGFPRHPRVGPATPRFPQPASPAPVAPYTPPPAVAAAAQDSVPDGDKLIDNPIDFEGVDVNQVLDVYSMLVNKTVLRAALPSAKIILKTQTPLTRNEAVEALKAVLAMNNISIINVDDKFVKAVPSDQAGGAGGPIDDSGTTNYAALPNLGSYMTRVVQLQYVLPSDMAKILTPFSKLKDSLFPIDGNGILVIRDYTENVKRMLELIKKIDVSVPAEYISEVIPIRYAKVDDIANALNSLGSGGGTVASIGTAPSRGRINGFSSPGGGFNSMGGSSLGGGMNNGNMGTTQPFGRTSSSSPSGGRSTFQDRLKNIINKASGDQDQIQLFGETKIIPNESSSSLLIFATRHDMATITNIVAKLDVPLAQVLIEAMMIDYSLGPNKFQFGTSVAQNPKNFSGSSTNILENIIGAGGFNNASFFNFASSALGTNATSGLFGNSLGSGLSYFGNLGPTWDVAVNAVASDSHANVIQRPSIQAEQGKPAQFFVGDTVPYATGNNYGGVYGNSTSYSQLSVGVELDVTPFINPAGEVAMDIDQEIDDLNGTTHIENVGDVPNTIKRTLSTSMTIRDGDTVMLGGFIKANKSASRSGVPFLQDIPLLGALFSERSDAKRREELIVLMRPTVLKTPELAAQHTISEEQKLPGVSQTMAEDQAEERRLIDAQRKREQEQFERTKHYDGFYMQPPAGGTNSLPGNAAITNQPAQTSVPSPRAQAEFEQKAQAMMPGNVTPAQAAKLNDLLAQYMADKITTEQFQAARLKILRDKQ